MPKYSQGGTSMYCKRWCKTDGIGDRDLNVNRADKAANNVIIYDF